MNSTQHESAVLQCANPELALRDQEFLLAARAGSHAAFAELQNIHAFRLYKRILSVTKNREDAEDALQDTFFRAYRAFPSFEGRSSVSTWLTRIAINSALMILRKRRACPEMAIEKHSGAEADGCPFETRDDALSPEQLVDQRQRCTALLIAVQGLDTKLRNAMNIRITQGNSMQEIGNRLGVSPAAVKARLHRARKQLANSPAFRDQSAMLKPSNRKVLTRRHENWENAA